MTPPGTERLVPAKKGYTVYAGETALHSRYDPGAEAEKYAASLEADKNCRCMILIEPGLPYLERALRRSFPGTEIISLHCSPFFSKENPALREADLAGEAPEWNPAAAVGLDDFLEEILEAHGGGGNEKSGDGGGAAEIKLVEWRPAVNAYGRSCADVAAGAVECVRRWSAGRATVRNFGRRWVRNALRNLELPGETVEARRGASPVLVCAAGPGLEDSLEGILRWLRSPSPPFVVAVSSAVPALLYRGIVPGMVAATDGGPWALFHLLESLRRLGSGRAGEGRPVLAAALTAALPSQAAELPAFFLCDGSLWQELLLRNFGLPFVSFPQRGTVSAAALDLARLLGGGVYLAGLDLAHRDLRTHARPHAFEPFLDGGASRLAPRYTRIFEREAAIRRSGSHGIYAAWFKSQVKTAQAGLYTLGDGTALGLPRAEIPPGENAPAGAAAAGGGGAMPRFLPRAAKGPPGGKRRRGVSLLLEALDDPLTAEKVGRELGELLLPGFSRREKADRAELERALLTL